MFREFIFTESQRSCLFSFLLSCALFTSLGLRETPATFIVDHNLLQLTCSALFVCLFVRIICIPRVNRDPCNI